MVLTDAGSTARRTRGLGRGICFVGPLQFEQGPAYFEVEIAALQRSSQTIALGICAALPCASKPLLADRAKDLGPGTCVLGYDLPKLFAHGAEVSRLPVKQWRPVKELAVGDRVGLLVERVAGGSSCGSIAGAELSLSVAVNGTTRTSVRVLAHGAGNQRWPQDLWGVVDVHGGVTSVRLPGARSSAEAALATCGGGGGKGPESEAGSFADGTAMTQATQAHPADGGGSPYPCSEGAASLIGSANDTFDHSSGCAEKHIAEVAPALPQSLFHSATVFYQRGEAAQAKPALPGAGVRDAAPCKDGTGHDPGQAPRHAGHVLPEPGPAQNSQEDAPQVVPLTQLLPEPDGAAATTTPAAAAAAGGAGAPAAAARAVADIPAMGVPPVAGCIRVGAATGVQPREHPAATPKKSGRRKATRGCVGHGVQAENGGAAQAASSAEAPAKRCRMPARSHDCGCMVHLIQHTGGVVHVPGTDFVIGRNRLVCNLTLDSPLVPNMASRKHAHIVCAGDGEVKIIDCDSLNGTWVNGTRVSHRTLQQNDVLVIGNPAQSPPDFCFSVSLPPPLRPQ